MSRKREHGDDSDDEDPLDAFMRGIESDLKREAKRPRVQDEEGAVDGADLTVGEGSKPLVLGREENAGAAGDGYERARWKIGVDKNEVEVEEFDYDSEGDPIARKHEKRAIEPLNPVNHDEIDYERDFYEELLELSSRSKEEVADARRSLNIRVVGDNVPGPISSFSQCAFPRQLVSKLLDDSLSVPTPIQKQAIPVALSGFDLVGSAKTGSGKYVLLFALPVLMELCRTLAFVLPLAIHIGGQSELKSGETGPIALIIAPTRELVMQISQVARRYLRAALPGLHVAGVWGGADKNAQFKELRRGADVVVATPGRMIDLVKMKACSFRRVTIVVVDECDRCFDLGFEPQVRSLIKATRPDRQTLLFSATLPHSVERLIRDVTTDPVYIDIGHGSVNEDVTQCIIVLENEFKKWGWTMSRLEEMSSRGNVLVFVSRKAAAEELAANLLNEGFHCAALHGDKEMNERTRIVHAFKSGALRILIATDVAARGLDIPAIKTVVNFDVPRNILAHIHRVGRAGRAGDRDGIAYTILTQKDTKFAGDLVKSLEGAGQVVSDELLALASKNPRFRRGGIGNRRRGQGLRRKGSVNSGARLSGSNTLPVGKIRFEPATAADSLARSTQSQQKVDQTQPMAQDLKPPVFKMFPT